MAIHPLLAIATPEIIIGVLVLGALLFGADKLPKLARSAGAAKKEFMMGQIEADEATAKAREEARLRVEREHSRPDERHLGRIRRRTERPAADARQGNAELLRLHAGRKRPRSRRKTRRGGIKKKCPLRST